MPGWPLQISREELENRSTLAAIRAASSLSTFLDE